MTTTHKSDNAIAFEEDCITVTNTMTFAKKDDLLKVVAFENESVKCSVFLDKAEIIALRYFLDTVI